MRENTNAYGNKKWTETNHNLDFIIEKDRKVYGSEVKNTWDYIDKEEFEIKLKMCRYLGIKPLFIQRMLPKNYINEIVKQGGYAMIFKTQIYPFGQEDLVNRIKEVLVLPAVCSKAIADGIIDRFLKWHSK